ncbi:MAG TPA: protein-arginine deiminase family protein [Kofleriaceae bacterium]|nr:protein-arginine deiminase family protein [Kofleriaceae bacterium]
MNLFASFASSRLILLGALAACTSPSAEDGISGGGGGGKSDDVTAAWQSVADVHGVPNLDDDDEDGTADWQQAAFPADDDRTPLGLTADMLAALPDGHTLALSLAGDAVELSQAGALVPDELLLTDLSAGPLLVELQDFGARAVLTIEERDEGGAEVARRDVTLAASPLLLHHHLQPAEHVWAMSVASPGSNNQALMSAYHDALGDLFTPLSSSAYGGDVWVQDEIELGGTTGADGERLDVVVDSIRNRGLDSFPEKELVQPGVIAATWGTPGTKTTFDSFGNLETTPPVPGYPFGRIYYGRTNGVGLDADLAAFLAAQEVQAPIELPTSWLCVGHVDEVLSTLPDPSSPLGFKLLVADVPSALAILDAAPATQELGRYQFDHGYATVGALRSDAALRAYNLDLQAQHLDGIRTTMMAELGLGEADVIRVPSLFERSSGCNSPGRALALLPGMANLMVVNAEGAAVKVFVPDPFFRDDDEGQERDPFIAAFAERMPPGLELFFVDDWDVYHLSRGEVHCGANVRRTPTAAWWTAAPVARRLDVALPATRVMPVRAAPPVAVAPGAIAEMAPARTRDGRLRFVGPAYRRAEAEDEIRARLDAGRDMPEVRDALEEALARVQRANRTRERR